jgi:hypothetical protein
MTTQEHIIHNNAVFFISVSSCAALAASESAMMQVFADAEYCANSLMKRTPNAPDSSALLSTSLHSAVRLLLSFAIATSDQAREADE